MLSFPIKSQIDISQAIPIMVDVIIVRHTIPVFEMYPTTDKLNLPLNLSSIQELVYIC